MKTLIGLILLAVHSPYLCAQSQVQKSWVRHYSSGLIPGSDYAVAIAIDKSYNVYVTGYSPSVPTGYDYVTIKYDFSGSEIWAMRYNGPGNGDDRPAAMAVDEEGNAYVTGSSYVSNTDVDFVTLKYDTEGVLQWVKGFDGSDNLIDEARDLVLDGYGNIYVTGKSHRAESLSLAGISGYVTIKYSSTGEELWAKRYKGSESLHDQPVAIAVGDSGSVYVTGESAYGPPGSGASGYTTIKYSPAGVQQWVVSYLHNLLHGHGQVAEIAVDALGNAYVSGTFSSSSFSEYVTVKYSTNGVEQWVARDGGFSTNMISALGLDISGNAYVTGTKGLSDVDYATIKYNSDGITQWVSRYSGSTANSQQRATALAIDKPGNIYVAGRTGIFSSDYTTIKYNSNGVEEWIATYPGLWHIADPKATAVLTIDDAGNSYVTGNVYVTEGAPGTGSYHPDYTTVKYDSGGTEQWVVRYDESQVSVDQAYASIVDALGNVYITGVSLDSNRVGLFSTVKYNSAGTQEWVRQYYAPTSRSEAGMAIALDKSGHVYVNGTSYEGSDSSSFVTMKYDSEGTQLWSASFTTPQYSHRNASALAVDVVGNVYHTGRTEYEYVTVKYDSSGVELWHAIYKVRDNFQSRQPALVVDSSGNVFINGDNATIKYNHLGQEKWIVREIYPNAIAVDLTGNIYVAGTDEQGYDANTDFITIKYDSTGNKIWEARYNAGFGYSVASALAIGPSGRIYVTGHTLAQTHRQYVTVAYDFAGIEQWIARHEGQHIGFSEPAAIVLDKAENVYVTGSSFSEDRGNLDYATVKYDSNGREQWRTRYSGPGEAEDYAVGIGLDAANNVYVSGWSQGKSGDGWATYTTVKYTQSLVSVEEDESSSPHIFHLAQNYPNPFNPSTTIRYTLARPGHVTLKIFSLSGQEVATLVDEIKSQGAHEVQWEALDLPCGVYFYRLQAGNESVQARKLLLLK